MCVGPEDMFDGMTGLMKLKVNVGVTTFFFGQNNVLYNAY